MKHNEYIKLAAARIVQGELQKSSEILGDIGNVTTGAAVANAYAYPGGQNRYEQTPQWGPESQKLMREENPSVMEMISRIMRQTKASR